MIGYSGRVIKGQIFQKHLDIAFSIIHVHGKKPREESDLTLLIIELFLISPLKMTHAFQVGNNINKQKLHFALSKLPVSLGFVLFFQNQSAT